MRSPMALTKNAATADYERDDDFQFVRKSKRVKTEEPESAEKPARGRPPAKGRVAKETRTSANVIPEEPAETATQKPRGRKSTRRKPSIDALVEEEPPAKTSKRSTRRSTRLSAEKEPDEEPPQTNGTSRKRGRRAEAVLATRPAHSAEPEPEPETEAQSQAAPAPAPSARAKKHAKNASKSPRQEPPVESAKIALPMSDTPIINRNKEMRKKGTSNRRSSLGMRGRRASSLIESGQTAIPHRSVNPTEFYKHIEAEGLTEPRRMKQLLTWCGERALAEKPPLGTPNSNAILGGRRKDALDSFSRIV